MAIDLQILADRIAIEERLFLYAHYIDTAQFDRVAPEIFTEDADIMLGGVSVVGRAAFTASLNMMTGMMAGTSHNVTNVMIDVRGDEAHANSRTIAWHWFAGPDADPFAPADFTAVGAYQDRLRRTAEGWRIYQRRAMNFGTGVGIGAVDEDLKPVIRGMAGRVHQWPVA
jgi:hypothetical protein